MKTLRNHLVPLAVATAFAATMPAFANHPPASPFFGTPVHDGSVDRTIEIHGGTKWVNVTGGETIRFVVDDKGFSWYFDVRSNDPTFKLDKIAPAGILGTRSITVYVKPDPLYAN